MRRQSGFTLMELLIVFAIAALVVGVTVPFGVRFYDTMQYRSALREISGAASAARYQAITRGRPMDLLLHAERREFGVEPAGLQLEELNLESLPGKLQLDITSAREVSPGNGFSAIRFYPQGGSSGGSVSVIRSSGDGTRLRVDWLLGRVTQEALEQR